MAVCSYHGSCNAAIVMGITVFMSKGKSSSMVSVQLYSSDYFCLTVCSLVFFHSVDYYILFTLEKRLFRDFKKQSKEMKRRKKKREKKLFEKIFDFMGFSMFHM